MRRIPDPEEAFLAEQQAQDAASNANMRETSDSMTTPQEVASIRRQIAEAIDRMENDLYHYWEAKRKHACDQYQQAFNDLFTYADASTEALTSAQNHLENVLFQDIGERQIGRDEIIDQQEVCISQLSKVLSAFGDRAYVEKATVQDARKKLESISHIPEFSSIPSTGSVQIQYSEAAQEEVKDVLGLANQILQEIAPLNKYMRAEKSVENGAHVLFHILSRIQVTDTNFSEVNQFLEQVVAQLNLANMSCGDGVCDVSLKLPSIPESILRK